MALGLVLLGTSWLLPANAHAQDGELDSVAAVVAVLFSGDEGAVRDVVSFTDVACEVEPIGPGAPPSCPDGAAEGTLVQAFPRTFCAGSWAFDLEPIVSVLTPVGAELVSVHADTAASGEYDAVYTNVDGPEGRHAVAVVINGGKVVGLHWGCGTPSAQDLIADLSLGPATELPTDATELPSTGTGTLYPDHAPRIAVWLVAVGVVVLSGGALVALRRR